MNKSSKPGGLAARRKGPSLSGLNPVSESVIREQIAANTLTKCTNIQINGQTINIDPQDMETVYQLGKGAYGIVELVRHKPSGIDMAVKKTAISQEQKRFLMDMDVLVKAVNCPFIVKFYGASFWEGDLWIYMEVMDSSLDKFYRLVYGKGKTTSLASPLSTLSPASKSSGNSVPSSSLITIPEYVLGKIAHCVIQALNYLHGIDIIHRDVKPSNILINRAGEVKLCDFGIAGPLVDSVAKTIEVGCKPYMAPERINPPANNPGYDIRSDVWSLGITMLEMGTGEFPYSTQSDNFFVLLKSICSGDPPKPPPNRFSDNFEDFIDKCLQFDYQKRPYYSELLKHPFVVSHQDKNISDYVVQILSRKDTLLPT